MKQFTFYDFFYDAVSPLTREQKGLFLEKLCEYFFNENNSVGNDEVVNTVANMAVNFIRKQNKPEKLEWEQKKQLSKEILEYCKDNFLIIKIKAGEFDDIQKLYDIFEYKEVVDTTVEWIRTKYKENFYF